MKMLFVVAAFAAMLLSGSDAFRMPRLSDAVSAVGSSWGPSAADPKMLEAWLAALDDGTDANRKKKSDSEELAVASRLYVKPEHREEFIEKFLPYLDQARQEEGNIVADLKKTLSDNIEFFSYSEWKSKEDFMEHIQQDYTKELAKYLDSSDTVVTLHILRKLSDTKRRHHNKGGDDDDDDDDDKNKHAHILTKFEVAPGTQEKFIRAWEDAEDDTLEEDGNIMFELSRPLGQNTVYLGYAVWEDYKDLKEHWRSKHFERFISDLNHAGVAYNAVGLVHVEKKEERQA